MHADEAGCAARHAHVTCATFSRQGEIVATYNDEVNHPVAVSIYKTAIVRSNVLCSKLVKYGIKLDCEREQVLHMAVW